MEAWLPLCRGLGAWQTPRGAQGCHLPVPPPTLQAPASLAPASQTPGKGRGLKALSPIAEGDLVLEYVGEMISGAEMARRLAEQDVSRSPARWPQPVPVWWRVLHC